MSAVYLLGMLGACAAPTPRVLPVAPEGATPVGPFVPEARALFEGCTPVPDSATSRTYRCDGLSLWVAEPTDLTADGALEEAKARIQRRLWEGLVVVQGELPLAGRAWPSARFSACGEGGGACRAGGYVTVVTVELGRVRQLGCVARGDSRPALARCLELFEYLASQGNPEGEVLKEEALLVPPRLPWRALAVPQDCQLSASTSRAGRIRCGEASFVWSVYQPARGDVTRRWQLQSVEELAEALPGSGPVEEVPCLLESQRVRCTRFTAPTARGPLEVWSAAVEWEDRALFASCSFLSSETPFPAVCNGAFSLP
ncbi:hypothetical protein [Pyxidicoccus xibeiensis]|uniref:hypothetical protein n=1 Tax=Pyxidicoccus xibeiensis TaxID=2906759 RepID=UPI0020A778CC|nr:hypothetical protein [Pyxidicoccus xibeiensis]MCP3136258.1 hypothetical protein [Pyxidicoccus xibeiensis]